MEQATNKQEQSFAEKSADITVVLIRIDATEVREDAYKARSKNTPEGDAKALIETARAEGLEQAATLLQQRIDARLFHA